MPNEMKVTSSNAPLSSGVDMTGKKKKSVTHLFFYSLFLYIYHCIYGTCLWSHIFNDRFINFLHGDEQKMSEGYKN
jgi:hypothetical protein